MGIENDHTDEAKRVMETGIERALEAMGLVAESYARLELESNPRRIDTIMIYQSMSGDADSGTSTFDMTNGSLTSENGHVFHVTNTNDVINLNNVKIVNKDSENILLSVCDDGWSGADNISTLNAVNQTLEGDVSNIVSNGFTLYVNGTAVN